MAREVSGVERRGTVGRINDRFMKGYGLVLVLLGSMFVLIGSSDRPVAHAALVISASAAIILSYRLSGVRPLVMRGVLVVTVIVAVTSLVLGPYTADFNSMPAPALLALLVCAGPFVVVRGILRHEIVSTETILGSICGYVYMGLAFGFIYGIFPALGETLFTDDAPVTPSSLNYFSFVTLTTLGYGDLTPAGGVVRQVAFLEAMAGQIYLVTLVARLVGLYGARRPQSR